MITKANSWKELDYEENLKIRKVTKSYEYQNIFDQNLAATLRPVTLDKFLTAHSSDRSPHA